MSSVTYVYTVVVLLFVFAAIVIILGLIGARRASRVVVKGVRAVKSYAPNGHRYVPGQFSDQMELDMRLPYRRFRQLYPESRWTYQEYKSMQTQTAFRRSFSSQDNKRMVR